ncbi:hypothetical protein IZU99_03090 [Oscillospiraceae bacterium CM]|nr:hypothetical protein IZU99_03090 [Oscillospiraceae bacterium CM]
MATTAQEVFYSALALMDETDQLDAFKNRALALLTVLRNELYRYSDTFEAEEGKRPVCGAIQDFLSPIDLDDGLAQSVMPYGLAAHLLLEENPATASFFQQRYEELMTKIGQTMPRRTESIENLYGEIRI